MDKVSGRLTVFFEEPFWVGVFERISEGKLSVCKVTFGAEPKDYEIYDFILKEYDCLRFSPAVEAVVKDTKMNPKRRQRAVRCQLEQSGIGTKAQQALKLQQEQNGIVRQTRQKLQRQEQQRLQYELRQQKKKEKHRGR